MFEREGVRGFDRPVTGNPPAHGAGRQFGRDERRRRDHHTVEYHRCATHGGLCQEPGHRGDVGAADSSHECEGIVDVASSAPHAVADGRSLPHPAEVVDAGAAADYFDRLVAGQGTDENRCGSGVSDAHLTRDEKVCTRVNQVVDDGTSCGDGRASLGDGQRIGDAEVAAAASNLVARDLGWGVGVDRHVDDVQRRAALAGEDVDRCASRGDVRDHLRGHLGRVRGDTGLRDAVIAREHHHVRLLDRAGRTLALTRGDPCAEVFEPAERTSGLGQGELTVARGLRDGLVRTVDVVENLGIGRDDFVRLRHAAGRCRCGVRSRRFSSGCSNGRRRCDVGCRRFLW
ncbi:Uncharacterised protein [Mycobacteroides abscessus subsp. abscessus]|nr:Uncharacterised protein [Mycobacteroides abscessus subsp. abscessus]